MKIRGGRNETPVPDVCGIGYCRYTFSVYVTTTGHNQVDTYGTNSWDSTSAEYFVEHPAVGTNQHPPLRNFGTARVNAAQANAGAGRIGMQNFPLDEVTLTTNGRLSGKTLALPSTNNGQSFTDTWKACS